MAQKPYVLADMTWPEVQEALETVEVAIIPTGSNEQHGPHMALKMDIVTATAMALKIEQRMFPKALVAPPIPYGISPHHMGFPGTISLRPETFVAVVKDVISSLKDHGIVNFLVLNGHGGNMNTLGEMMMNIRQELKVNVAYALYWPPRDVMAKYAAAETWGHACDLETSWALYLEPDIVRMDKLAKGQVTEFGYKHATGRGVITVPYAMGERTTNGALGDPTQGSYEKGEAMLEPMVDVFAEFLEDFIAKNKA